MFLSKWIFNLSPLMKYLFHITGMGNIHFVLHNSCNINFLRFLIHLKGQVMTKTKGDKKINVQKAANIFKKHIYCVSQKKRAPTNGAPSYKCCFEEGCNFHIIQMPQLLATNCQKRGFIWWDSFAVMTSNVNFYARPILQLFVIALCAISQPVNRKTTKMVLHVSLRLKSYLEN